MPIFKPKFNFYENSIAHIVKTPEMILPYKFLSYILILRSPNLKKGMLEIVMLQQI